LGHADGRTRNGAESSQGWNVLAKWDSDPRQPVYRSLCRLLRPLSQDERQTVLHQLMKWAGGTMQGRPTHRALSAEELVRLADGTLVEVGAHTVSHPVLSALPASDQHAEICGSKARLEEILGRPVQSFAYPYGARSDYTGETAGIVREAGFSLACANFPEVVRRSADIFQLPRLVVRDWNGDTFARKLSEWSRGRMEEAA
jgi:peptidoglycan/xylan/chitin deacetylase (PgdA/CDA1 family)